MLSLPRSPLAHSPLTSGCMSRHRGPQTMSCTQSPHPASCKEVFQNQKTMTLFLSSTLLEAGSNMGPKCKQRAFCHLIQQPVPTCLYYFNVISTCIIVYSLPRNQFFLLIVILHMPLLWGEMNTFLKFHVNLNSFVIKTLDSPCMSHLS